MDRDPAEPIAVWVGLGPRRQRRLLGLFGSLVTARYSFLVIRAVDQMRAAPPAAFASPEQEQLLRYYMAWMLGLLAMLLPVMLYSSPRLMGISAMVIDLLLLVLLYEHE